MSAEPQDDDPDSPFSYEAWIEREKQGWQDTYTPFDSLGNDEPAGAIEVHRGEECISEVPLAGMTVLSAPEADLKAGVLHVPGTIIDIGFFHEHGEDEEDLHNLSHTTVSLTEDAAEWLAAKLSELVRMHREARTPPETPGPPCPN
jgi:hypothetical protein